MGRYWGSGRRTVEQARGIEIGALQRAGYFATSKQGWWIWRQEGEIIGTAQIDWDGERLTIRAQVIDIGWPPCRFGGHRFWFRCSCGRHVATLYSPNGRPWGCRHCYRLTYATRQAVPRDRHLLRAQRIRRRLGGSPNMLEDFPPRPKGMHWQRYERMRDVHDLAQGKAMMGFMQFVDRLECRVGIRR